MKGGAASQAIQRMQEGAHARTHTHTHTQTHTDKAFRKRLIFRAQIIPHLALVPLEAEGLTNPTTCKQLPAHTEPRQTDPFEQ